MKTIDQFLEEITGSRDLGREIAHREEIPSRPPRWGGFPSGLRPCVKEGLSAIGINRLYTHQSTAMKQALEGRDLVVVTPTASGKTLCYNVPVVNRCLEKPETRALYLFPIKALEQDQIKGFREFAGACGAEGVITAEIYDGDTSSHKRARIRNDPPNVVISNPDMLHMGILAYHQRWESFFSNLEYVVLDEVHTYRGVFGSHVAHVLRRLLRIARFYGADPSVIACSATIANPGELVSGLVGRDVGVVDDNGAPEAGRRFLFINPVGLSASTVATRILKRAVEEDLATIVFTKARKMTELIYTWTVMDDPAMRRRISAYRAGYLPGERREIEQKLFTGKLKAVVATSALEMGIDIGGLDVCVLVGYPGAITTTWQRGGRVGRQDRESLIVLIAGRDALDQYFMKHPRVFFDSSFESAVIDPGNRPILKSQLTCAAAEIPIGRDDPIYLPVGGGGEKEKIDVPAAIEELEKEGGLLRAVGEESWHSSKRYPQRDVNIRGIGESNTIFEEPSGSPSAPGEDEKGAKPRIIGSLDGNRVFSEGHPGAVYLHRASQYRVTRLDLDNHNLWARRVRADYYTQPLREKRTDILSVQKSKPVRNFIARLGDLMVTEKVTGYEKKSIYSGERLSVHELDLPSFSFETVGFWIEMDEFIPETVEGHGLNFMGGIHAIEHAAIALFPLFAFCERDDVGGISIPVHPQVKKAAVFIYDGYPGGVGLCEKSFARIDELLGRTLSVIAGCDCEKGCPACIYSNKCGNGNVPLDKKAAVMILSILLDREESREWIIRQCESNGPPDVEPMVEKEPPAEEKEGPRVLVLDIETKRGAGEVGGWTNCHLMGLAVAVVWDSRTGSCRSYFEDQAGELLLDLASADLVVGFNLIGFDYKVLSAYDNGSLAKVRTFDILQDIRRRLGYRLSLAHLAEKTLGASKTADGLQSLEWVKQGRLDLVEEYCRNDVMITQELFSHGLSRGYVRFENREGRLLELALDWDLDEIIKEFL